MTDPGYRKYERILSDSECDQLLDSLSSQQIARGRAGARHLMSHPEVATLASDSRLLGLAQLELGLEAVPFRATLFEKTSRANWLVIWHQDTTLPLETRFDTREWGPWSRKGEITYAHAPAWALSRILALRVHLDASTSKNGPLRVLPGSHAAGVLTDEEVFAWAAKHTHVECLVERGGLLAMRPLLIHSSSKVRVDAPRRVLHIEYADSLALAPGIRLAVA